MPIEHFKSRRGVSKVESVHAYSQHPDSRQRGRGGREKAQGQAWHGHEGRKWPHRKVRRQAQVSQEGKRKALNFRGIDATSPINRLKAGFCTVAVNVRRYLAGGFALRNALSDAIYTLSAAVQSIARMNTTSGYTIFSIDKNGKSVRRRVCRGDRSERQQSISGAFSAESIN